MTPQVAERLLYESEAALRLVDSLLAELEEGGARHVEDDFEASADGRALVPAQLIVDELALLREDLAEVRIGLERSATGSSGDEARVLAARVLWAAEERLDTLARRIDLLSPRGR